LIAPETKCRKELPQAASSDADHGLGSEVRNNTGDSWLKDYYALRALYIESGKGRAVGSNVARRIDPFVFNLPPAQPP
jgi:hypothetical protein